MLIFVDKLHQWVGGLVDRILLVRLWQRVIQYIVLIIRYYTLSLVDGSVLGPRKSHTTTFVVVSSKVTRSDI